VLSDETRKQIEKTLSEGRVVVIAMNIKRFKPEEQEAKSKVKFIEVARGVS